MSRFEIHGLNRNRDDGTPLFRDVSFVIPANKPHVLCLRGPSGAGKSTLLKAISQMIPNDGGTVLLGGK
ncbi:hypothetical protein BDK51DRAFT_16416 [Blyttiomyces helicus]|uniref:ABC transporter domain-containing protein n=1 Tax=Blyttiomyces helicus TaxID=388810 RepID=A0A4P9W4E3_9FUNG|nr:hypothetical protein BDK51DRAFT_16416 [Blyttiomyces helicus]|eukprot:RKO87064.1 hypothetical protein BDK51DRAFT_16416 [Blyttiomyces helicus]